MSRVVITAAAVICPIGHSVEEVFDSLDSGRSGLVELSCFESASLPVRHAGEVRFGGRPLVLDPAVDRKEHFLKAAMAQIFQNGTLERYARSLRSLHLGAGLDYFDLPDYVEVHDGGQAKWLDYSRCTHSIVRALAAQYGFAGGFSVNVSACVASSQALGLAYRLLKGATSGAIVSGGVDSMLNPFHYMGFYKLGALSSFEGPAQAACRPFDKHRTGLVLGEGAALYTLESPDTADPRSILAEIAGYSSSCDGYLVTDPDPDGKTLAKAALTALAEAGVSPQEVDCVHMHGTGTLKNDLAEARALALIFGGRFKEIPVYSMKGQVGHLISACGAVELLGVLYSLQRQKVPATANYRTPDPEIPLRVIQDKPFAMRIKNVLKLNCAFGGQNTALVLKEYAK